MSYVHLHTHSQFSWLDGACIIDDLVQRAVELKMPAVSITDRNSVAGASLLWHRCIKAGIKPIIGLEIEVLNDPGDGRAFSVILLAKNGSGYENLCRLITLAYERDPFNPRIIKTQLRDHAQDLICLSFSVVGELCTLLLEGCDEAARQVSDWYYEVFGEDYYYELQYHGLPKEAIAMNKLLNLTYMTGIPVVLTNDCHYLEPKESSAIDALNCLRKGIDFSHPEAKRFACNEYYFKTPKEMKALYQFPARAIKNTLAIAEKINVTDGYIPVSDDTLSVAGVVNILRTFSHSPGIDFKPNSKHINVSLMDCKSADLLKHLRKKLPDYDILQFTEYEPWMPQAIYAEVLKTMRVPEAKIRELCEVIPPEAKTLLEAFLISTDFSCLSSEDFVCESAFRIADTLIDTFKEERPLEQNIALIPKDMAIPVVRDSDGIHRAQYDSQFISELGLISLEFRP
ncbi:MAG TPA: PHP domain-containing protein [Candidatus Cloacimonadota bacterium]|nr:PHP domain-containing protein [Candidatus Cloacimonadota bacterium]